MKIIAIIVCSLIFATSCEKNSMNSDDIVTYYYDETQCSDPWQTEVAITIDTKKEQLGNFLTKNDIDWMTIEVVKETNLNVECESCDCGTGFRFLLTVGNEFIDEIKEFGFKPRLR